MQCQIKSKLIHFKALITAKQSTAKAFTETYKNYKSEALSKTSTALESKKQEDDQVSAENNKPRL